MTTIAPSANRIANVPQGWLPLLRITVIIILVAANIFFVLGIPHFYESRTTLCALPQCEPLQITAQDAARLAAVGLSVPFYALAQIGIEIVNVVFINLICLYYFRRHISHWMGYVAILTFVAFFFVPNVVWTFFDANPGIRPIGETLNDITFLALFTLIYILPNGRFVPRWSFLFLIVGLIEVFGRTIASYYPADFSGTELALPEFLSPLIIAILAGIGFQIFRYFRVSTPSERKQTRWVLVGFGFIVLGIFTWTFFIEYLAYQPDMPRVWIQLVGMPIIMLITVVPLPIALTLAISEHRMWDMDLFINRTVVYAVLTAIIALTFVFVVSILNLILGSSNSLVSSTLATTVALISFQAIREPVQRGVNRLMFGQRGNPQLVLQTVSEELQQAVFPRELLQASTETIASTLKLPYVAILIQGTDGHITKSVFGAKLTPTQAFPLVHQNEVVGELSVGQRSPEDPLNDLDQRVLTNIAQQMGPVVYAVRLQSDLQAAREHLVITREEERRRLRRDLHDGLGPALAGQTLKLDAAIELVEAQPEKAIRLLTELKAQTKDLVTDIRHLVHDLRPATLDDLGLLPSLQMQAENFATGSKGLNVKLNVPEKISDVSAAVEVAVYRIVQEALTNVVRHAEASECVITLMVNDHTLDLTVSDDGQGLRQPIQLGVGLRSMRERAEELGGTFNAENAATGGTTIQVRLPVELGV